MTDKLAHSITGFRKSHGTQNSLVVMLEKWKRTRIRLSAIYGSLKSL